MPSLHRHDAASVLLGALRALDPHAGEPVPFALDLWDGSSIPQTTPEAAFRLKVTSPDALAHLVRQPDELGAGRAWVSGALDVEGDLDLALRTLLERFAGAAPTPREKAALLAAAVRLGALRRPPIPAAEARPEGSRHSLRRDAGAVRHHYDVPTSFYRLLLGPSLVYSCAAFEDPAGESLEAAQERKLAMICRKLDLRPGERFLDIGCGWGSLVLHAAREHGVRATGVTLSASQAAEAQRRVEAAGLADRVDVRVQDYRALRGEEPFDKVASVGMYEHVGRVELGGYVATLRALLRPGGRLLNHGIALLEPAEVRESTFTNRYVFPDAELTPLSAVLVDLEEQAFELRHVETLRESYVETLHRWSQNLAAHRDEAVAIVGAERERVWRLYLVGAAQGFEDGHLGVYQTLAVKLDREPPAAGRTPTGRLRLRAPVRRPRESRRPPERVRARARR